MPPWPWLKLESKLCLFFACPWDIANMLEIWYSCTFWPEKKSIRWSIQKSTVKRPWYWENTPLNQLFLDICQLNLLAKMCPSNPKSFIKEAYLHPFISYLVACAALDVTFSVCHQVRDVLVFYAVTALRLSVFVTFWFLMDSRSLETP